MSSNYLISFVPGQKIKASEHNNNYQYIMSEVNRQFTQLENYLKTEIDTIKTDIPKVGDIKLASYDTVPDKYLVCNGDSYLITEKQELFDVIGWTYGKPDELHFNVPDFRDKVPEGYGNESEAFGSFQKGLAPNIKGTLGLGGSGAYFAEKSGAFKDFSGSATRNQYQQEAGPRVVSFDASACSDVYKNDVNRITVDRLKINFLIRCI